MRDDQSQAVASVRTMVVDIAAIAVVSSLLFTYFFAGFGLGDDAAYAQLAASVATHGYPSVQGTDVFASRPLLLFLAAASLRMFGHHEWAFVLPVMMLAGLSAISVYLVTTLLASRPAGWLAAGALLLSPLQLTFATTFCNDIVGAGLWGLGLAVVFVSAHTPGNRLPRLVAAIGGIVAGLSLWIKLSFGLLAMPALALALVGVLRTQGTWRRSLSAGLVGFGASVIVLLLFFWHVAGDVLAGPRVELAFNRAHMLPASSGWSLRDTLMFYPTVASGLQVWGPAPLQWSPTGFFFPLVLLAACNALLRQHAARLIAACCLAMFLVLQFWPLQLTPNYVPIHRLPRFLYPVALPGAVLIGLAGWALWNRGSLAKALVASVAFVYIGSSLTAASRATAFHNDCMNDIRFSTNVAIRASGPVVVDSEMEPYLRFMARDYATPPQILAMDNASRARAGALVFVGGSRRPELDPEFAARRVPQPIPQGWSRILDMPGAVGPARRSRGAVYLVRPDGSPRPEMVRSCPSGRVWSLKDVVDVGNADSESAHAYMIEEQTWIGARTFGVAESIAWDDGRAFVGGQTFRARSLAPGLDVCLVKRIDARVAPQVSRWDVNGQELPVTRFDSLSNAEAEFGAISVIVPGKYVQLSELTLRERFVSSTSDVNVFRVELYQ